jgi:pimeloyl-ACP methyl ester carboxylesterase
VVVTDSDISPFEVAVAQSDLDDLRDRLIRTKWPDELDDAGWDYGVPLDYVKDLVSHWIDEFDWREQEALVNAHPQYVTSIDDETVHFIHVPSPEPDALPLIVTHGWPMSVFEYTDLIGPLTDPEAHGGRREDAFHLVIPSIPGIAFSGPTRTPGWDTDRTARAWATLMERLGYDRYGAHGNDAGSLISPELGRHDADHVVGVHVTQLFSFPSGDPSEFVDLSDEDAAAVQFLEGFTQGGGLAYNAYQSAQPQTLTYAMQDSPAGWLAWVAQLFRDYVDRDYIITNAATYWLTGTIGSSVRRYHADAHAQPGEKQPTTVPTGVAIFQNDFQSVRRFAERDHSNIVRWTHFDRGGHFAPRDAPDLLLEDLREFFRPLR